MHVPGLLGMPRRIYTYPADRGWEIWNLVTTLGVPLQVAGGPDLRGERRRARCAAAQRGGRRPVGRLDARVGHDLAAAALQLRDVPVVASRRPLWDLKHPDDPDGPHE